MRNKAIQSNMPFVIPNNDETYLEFASRATPKSPHYDTFHSDLYEELSEDVVFNEDGTIVANTLVLPFVRFQSKPSSSNSTFDFGSSTSTPDAERESTPKLHDDVSTNKPGPSEPPVNLKPAKNKLQDSTSYTGSSAGNYIDSFALLEIQSNVFDTMKKVDTIETTMAGLNSKIDEKAFRLESKLDAILQSLSEVNKSWPTTAEREAQLYLLVSLRIKHAMEQVEKKYDASVDHYLDTITQMLKVHDDLVAATKDLIKQTHVRHEKQIQRLEKEIRKKDEMNLIMQ